MSDDSKPSPTPTGAIAERIQLIRGHRVILDADLAAFYGETTKRFNQQVMRNTARFPADFMFQLNDDEFNSLRLQIATSTGGRGGRRYAPRAFTEHGAIMAATLLNSPLATEISVHVVRAFIELRSLMATHRELSNKVFQLDRTVTRHDKAINELMSAMQQALDPSDPPKRPIGFVIPEDKGMSKPKSGRE